MPQNKRSCSFNNFLNKEVHIYPADTYKKRGIVKEIGEHGILFLVTFAEREARDFVPGKLHFISYSSGIKISEV